jgi:drug/metabolite transporter (DMT)-like permease
MWRMTWPLLLIIISNTFYNICTKSIPEKTDAFGTLIITYIAGALIEFVLFFAHTKSMNFTNHFNWASVILGLAIVGLEAGYVYLFRAGWEISKGSLIANTCLAVVLMFVGYLMYHEHISFRQIIGAVVCLIGLYLISSH